MQSNPVFFVSSVLKSEKRNSEFTEERRSSQRPRCKRNLREVSYCQTEALWLNKSSGDCGHIFLRENVLSNIWRRRTDMERSGGEAIEGLGGKFTWRNHEKLELVARNATVSMLRKLNYGSTCKRRIAGVYQSQALSIMVACNQKAIGIALVRQRKNGPTYPCI